MTREAMESSGTGNSNAESSNAPASMVERMTVILDAFDDRTARLRLDEIAAHTGLPRSTSHRILEQLVRLRWLRHTQGGYALGQRALQLGGSMSNHAEIRTAAVPLLQELHARTGKVAHLGILDFTDVIYLDKIGGPGGVPVPSRVGGRVPAHAVSLGKAMLAWLPPEEVDTLLDEGMKAYSRNTITDLMVMHEELRRIRARHGLTFDHDEYIPGISCVGAAVRGPEGAVAGISLCGSTDATALERLAPLVLDVAKRISQRLFPDTSPEDMASTVWSDGMMERILNLIDDDALM